MKNRFLLFLVMIAAFTLKSNAAFSQEIYNAECVDTSNIIYTFNKINTVGVSSTPLVIEKIKVYKEADHYFVYPGKMLLPKRYLILSLTLLR